MRLISFISIFLFSMTIAAVSSLGEDVSVDLSQNSFSQSASLLIKQGKVSEALTMLEKIPSDSSAQPWALGEALKRFYVEQRWARFFGISAFARGNYPVSETRDEIQVLEILALLRHCQKDQAIELVRQGLSESSAAAKPRYEMLASLLEVASTAPDEDVPKEASATKTGSKLFRGKHIWPVPVKSVKKLDPWKLERKVEPICEKMEGAK